jgi:DNA-binding winged helix-turn-helix (wHTH) protein/Flp pilus assembly protein TadD
MLAGARGAPPGLRIVRDEPEPIILAHEPPFRIGEAEFRPQTREVIFGGDTTIVEPRVMQVLVALERAKGSVVSKDDLAARCWEGRIVGEDAINRVISRLRAVAEKQAGGQFRVETITKVGSRLIPVDGRVDSVDVAPSPASDRQVGRRGFLIGGAAVATAAATGGAWTLLRPSPMPSGERALLDDARQSIYKGSVEDANNAVGKLRQATAKAPNIAEAWGLLALAYAWSSAFAPSSQRANLGTRELAARQRAFALEPYQGDALAAGILSTRDYRNWYAYDLACQEALRHHPEHPVLNCLMGAVLAQTGRDRESLSFTDSALVKAPLSPRLLTCRALTLWNLGMLDEADAAIEHATELLPRYYGIWFTNLYYLAYEGRAREAAAMIDDVDSRPLGIPEWNYDLTTLHIHALASGEPAMIRKALDAFKAAASRGTGFTENAAIFAAYVGDLDEAFRLLNALYFNRGFAMSDAYFAKEQGMYSGAERSTYNLFGRPNAAIRRDPRFALLTRELGLDDYWARTNSRSLVNF